MLGEACVSVLFCSFFRQQLEWHFAENLLVFQRWSARGQPGIEKGSAVQLPTVRSNYQPLKLQFLKKSTQPACSRIRTEHIFHHKKKKRLLFKTVWWCFYIPKPTGTFPQCQNLPESKLLLGWSNMCDHPSLYVIEHRLLGRPPAGQMKFLSNTRLLWPVQNHPALLPALLAPKYCKFLVTSHLHMQRLSSRVQSADFALQEASALLSQDVQRTA